MALDRRRLPLFPLNVVLFPEMTLPVRIFERRYLQMVDDCVESDALFGVVGIRHGPEAGGPALPYDVGTTARIIAIERKSADLLFITTVGEERFRIRRLVDGKPYLVGEVEPYPLSAVNAPEVGALVNAQMALLSPYLELLSQVSELQIQVQRVPETPPSLAYFVGTLLQVPLVAKQQLLSAPDLPTMLEQGAALLQSDLAGLTVLIQGQDLRAGLADPHPFSDS
ncbi:MAG: LON peptidase substrate-binding domain-containing protein [Anaerolineae bacterium]|nr:LON peptidase substrate-binding domain-containing protein [Anaerolineae bacterium]